MVSAPPVAREMIVSEISTLSFMKIGACIRERSSSVLSCLITILVRERRESIHYIVDFVASCRLWSLFFHVGFAPSCRFCNGGSIDGSVRILSRLAAIRSKDPWLKYCYRRSEKRCLYSHFRLVWSAALWIELLKVLDFIFPAKSKLCLYWHCSQWYQYYQ